MPYVAAIPGLGLPMENNVFIKANYGWAFYTTNNKYLDNKTYYDQKRWHSLPDNWYASGAAYRKIDSVDGTPNSWLQCWLKHPDYDKYWQNQVPYQNDYSRGALDQQVDLTNRKTSTNNDYYPYPIIKKELDHSSGYFFFSQPFDKPTAVNGMFSGEIKATINKRDMDIGVVLYEVTAKSEYFELSYFLGRASYATDMSKRTEKLTRPLCNIPEKKLTTRNCGRL
ncbi:hypothetical protein J2W55_000738 [Mucilaginibacter pocheonensis]|uniref:Uncharacterized protein n=1 Tax=Mucilaginibacter pocheonensis TaxID=398050 RepID=A0ABU1T6T1_9SPHI|nr:hypothetical protein [Mucilaginibacter pocheonensis]